MSMTEAIRAGFQHYADFSGRARRPEFWWWILFTVLVSAVLGALPVGIGPVPDATMSGHYTFSGAWNIAVLLPSLAVTVRRLRDAGFAWGHVLWALLPVAGQIILAILCAQPTRSTGTARDATALSRTTRP